MSNQKASTLTRSLDLEAGCDINFSPNVKQIELINRLHATGFWARWPTLAPLSDWAREKLLQIYVFLQT